MKLIWIAVDPTLPVYEQLVADVAAAVQRHGGRVSVGQQFPGLDNGFPTSARFCLNDIARACHILMAQTEVTEP
ncbi:hypothetical protein KW807_00075 [Candidatus Parcubacteria bacterium]|nr:hypothetical protein [Candidatus Parcubacteria bacterium]